MLAKPDLVTVKIGGIKLPHTPCIVFGCFGDIYTIGVGALIHGFQIIDIEIEPILPQLGSAIPKVDTRVAEQYCAVCGRLSPQKPESETEFFYIPRAGVLHA